MVASVCCPDSDPIPEKLTSTPIRMLSSPKAGALNTAITPAAATVQANLFIDLSSQARGLRQFI